MARSRQPGTRETRLADNPTDGSRRQRGTAGAAEKSATEDIPSSQGRLNDVLEVPATALRKPDYDPDTAGHLSLIR
jgi:hypothetical protein